MNPLARLAIPTIVWLTPLLLATAGGCSGVSRLGFHPPAASHPVRYAPVAGPTRGVCVAGPVYCGYWPTCWQPWPESCQVCPPGQQRPYLEPLPSREPVDFPAAPAAAPDGGPAIERESSPASDEVEPSDGIPIPPTTDHGQNTPFVTPLPEYEFEALTSSRIERLPPSPPPFRP